MSLARTVSFLAVVSLVSGQEIPGDVEEATIDCGTKHITVTIRKAYIPDFQLNDLRLRDTSCPAAENKGENGTHFILQVPLVQCGTQSSQNNKSILYSNYVRQRPVENDVINRLSILRMPFTCAYPKEASASLDQLNVTPQEKPQVYQIDGQGGFNLQMTIFKDDSYTESYGAADYPVSMGLNQPMYVQLAVDSPDDRLSIIADSCYATPTQDPQDNSKYYIIEDSCPRDATYNTHGGPDNTQRFSFKSFQFVNGDDAQIFLHCKVFVCNKTDSNSRCAIGCEPVPIHKRQKRALHHGSYQLDRGPIKFVDQQPQAQQSTRFAVSQISTWVMVGMAAVCVLCLVGVIYARYQIKAIKRDSPDRESNI